MANGTTVEEVITRYESEEADYVRGTTRAANATKNLAKQVGAVKTQMKTMAFPKGWKGGAPPIIAPPKINFPKSGTGGGAGLPGVDDFIGLGKTVITTLAGVATAAGVAGIAAMRKAADFDALVKSLEAVEGRGEKVKSLLAELRKIAKLPGIELNDSIQSFVNLKRSGLGEDFAKNIIRELGNANAMSGGGQAEFSQIMRAITQIANKPFLQGDELVQLMEGGIPAYKLIKDIFGTSDTEELKRKGIDSRMVLEGLVTALSKMPRVAGGAKNDFENLGAAINQAMISAGAALNNAFLPRINEVTTILDQMSDSGAITRTFQDIAESLGGIVGGGSTEDVMYDMLANLKTIATGVMFLAENAKGFGEWAAKIAASSPGFKDMIDALGGGEGEAPSLADLHAKFMDEADMEQKIAAQKRKRAESKGPIAGGVEGPNTQRSGIVSPILETARNTARLVGLQQKQNEITKSILGGSGRAGIDAVTIANIKSGRASGRRTLEQAMQYFLAAVRQEVGGSVMENLISRARAS